MEDVGIALLIFIFSYFFLITEKGDRALVACAGGLLMVVGGVLNLELVFFRYIDWHTIALLLSMMIIVSISSQSGMFQFAAVKTAQLVKGKPLPLLVLLSVLTAAGSAFLNNVTTVLLITPVVFTLTGMLHLRVIPFLMAIIVSSNIGGTATLIGDPPNLMIGQAAKSLSFNDFLLHLGPPSILILLLTMAGLAVYYRNVLKQTETKTAREELMKVQAVHYITSKPLLLKSAGVLLLTIAAFLLQPFLKVELTAIAMGGALFLMFLTQKEADPEAIFKQMEWTTIFFFAGLFMLVGGLEETGLLEELARGIIFMTEGDMTKTSLSLLWVSGIVSGFVDNIPFVAAMIPVILELEGYGMGDLTPVWWALALGACLGGNATLIGATANVIVAGLATKQGHGFSYFDFFKIGAPTALLSLIVSTIYVYARYLMFY
ncbi:possible tyrosine transporter P-protein [Alteribacillus persepolensis]|uniref:Possible tyrosine transporter P-protein n=1 Tax=Alteribacillus persepolensis TaxID=568899 RepID=A0A1G8DHM4_9BACI|nr:ArsB/NhaD family transporter [Alteribacillus persepolensis]SDH57151.1 possible tyrosine transporter P-protein [Alteribacillus persepolensis]